MSRLRSSLVALALCALAACFASTGDLTTEGHGRPQLSLDFPATAAPGSTNDLVLHVTNPGPGAIDSLFVAFTNVGVPGSGLGTALVPFGRRGRSPAIAGVDPAPDGVSKDGVVYRFPALGVGDSTTITFSITVPHAAGAAASSVQVYDGSEPDRAVGMRVATTVRE